MNYITGNSFIVSHATPTPPSVSAMEKDFDLHSLEQDFIQQPRHSAQAAVHASGGWS
jgi:hypothetical protein